uniref:PHD-type domain-containing protein n=1 Tax=Anopheles melas TaxID=34690 RepID=A0A182UKT2_9DIPT
MYIYFTDDSVRSREWLCPKCVARSSQKETGLPTTSILSGDNPGSSTPTHQRDMMQEISLLFDQMKARMEKSSESPQTPQVRTRCYACEKTDAGNKILCNPCGRWCHISCLSEDEAASIASWKCALCTVARMRASTNVMDRLVDRLERLEQK